MPAPFEVRCGEAGSELRYPEGEMPQKNDEKTQDQGPALTAAVLQVRMKAHSGGLYLETSCLLRFPRFWRWDQTEAFSTSGGRATSRRDSLGAMPPFKGVSLLELRKTHWRKYAERCSEHLNPLPSPRQPWLSCSAVSPRVEKSGSHPRLTSAASSLCLLRAAARLQIVSRSLIAAISWASRSVCSCQTTLWKTSVRLWVSQRHTGTTFLGVTHTLTLSWNHARAECSRSVSKLGRR